MKMKILVSVALVAILGVPAARAGTLWDELTPAQKTAIQKGQQVFLTQDDSSSAWPKVWVYQAVQATPEEMAAVYTDYELEKSYIPDLQKAQISKVISPRVIEVDFTMHVPIFPNEDYTTRNTASAQDGSYRVDWTLVRATSTKATIGYARFEPIGNETLFGYYNFITPGSSVAGMVRDRAVNQMKEGFNGFIGQVKKERSTQQDLLQKQIQILRNALASPTILF